MKIKSIAANMTLVIFRNSAEIMFSYETPVAGHDRFGVAFRTTEKYSVTTSKHINKYLRDSHSHIIEEYSEDEILKLSDNFSKMDAA